MNTPAPPPPPPGWYGDPEDSTNLRWWDGESWGPLQPEDVTDFDIAEPDSTYDESVSSKKPSATPALILGIAAILLLGKPLWALILGLLSFFLAFRIVRNEEASNGNRFRSKISLVISGLAVLIAVVALSAEGSGSGASPGSTSSKIAQPASEEPFNPAEFTEMGERDFALIAKDPMNHQGEKLVVHGVVVQFDSNTGACSFRANTDAVQHSYEYDYDENTFISGGNASTCDYLEKNVVSNDQFKAWVQVEGVLDYETQIGGTSSALKLSALQIEVNNEVN